MFPDIDQAHEVDHKGVPFGISSRLTFVDPAGAPLSQSKHSPSIDNEMKRSFDKGGKEVSRQLAILGLLFAGNLVLGGGAVGVVTL
jgi:hypothetical protein